VRIGQRLAVIACALLATAGRAVPERSDVAEVGEAIYLRGVLPGGAPLEGTQSRMGIHQQGADAACVNCHQRSGLGSHEGASAIPPITGEYLFHPRLPAAHAGPAAIDSLHLPRAAYTDATLARAIRSGIDPEGRMLNDLMPRFDLDDAAIAALVAYLRELTSHRSPGVTDAALQFATVVTPDADPVARRGMLDVLERYVAERNSAPLKPSPSSAVPGTHGSATTMGMANRRWQLHLWALSGSPETWGPQLERQFAAQPVFALLSGLGTAHWAPVQGFCEQHAVPCFFPNVEVPRAGEHDFYSVYFSEGVLLEAQLIASAISSGDASTGVPTVRQVYRRGDSGEAAAAVLATALQSRKISVSSEILPAGAAIRSLNGAFAPSQRADILVLWLRPHDLAALARLEAPPPGRLYVSGIMSGLENAPLPPSWRANARLSYPFELPQRRGVQLDYARGWLSFNHIPVADLQVQADTYLACTLLSDALKLMADHASGPYLIEQLHGLLEHRSLTGYYPRLALGTHQHFASKGGYIVRFDAPQGATVVADTPWTVP
jgi:mono/diheme cytochrome c family protein